MEARGTYRILGTKDIKSIKEIMTILIILLGFHRYKMAFSIVMLCLAVLRIAQPRIVIHKNRIIRDLIQQREIQNQLMQLIIKKYSL
jgi:hypothetical protein